MTEKTHWLWNPNKNYLGHQDLPDGKDIVVTLKSGQWEKVVNPKLNTEEGKRVLRFEGTKWKPMICNETNAMAILKCTGMSTMEESVGKKIRLTVASIKVKGEAMDCLRVVDATQEELCGKPISEAQLAEIQALLDTSTKSAQDICTGYKIDSLTKITTVQLPVVIKGLRGFQKC